MVLQWGLYWDEKGSDKTGKISIILTIVKNEKYKFKHYGKKKISLFD